LSTAKIKLLEPVIDVSNAQGGFEYSDAFLHNNDARFVFNFIRNFMDNGAIIANYVKAQESQKIGEGGTLKWQTHAKDETTGETFTITSNAIVNACGPKVDD
jgi:glycerol-3-phosphate dehydrogenase